jgi:CRISPR system Cascade subunit CasD
MDVLFLRLEGPLLSFGAPTVDHHGVVQEFPPASMLTGLIANALGFDHGDFQALQGLQARIRFAARLDRRGQPLIDYQTVDLGQDFMRGTGWTTWGRCEERGGGEAKRETHIRYRHYRADGLAIVALTLSPPGDRPDLDAIESALRAPARPLFLGRKCCLPSSPVLQGRASVPDLLSALRGIPSLGYARVPAQWPLEEADLPGSRIIPVTDERDWGNQVHSGERMVRQGMIEISGGPNR